MGTWNCNHFCAFSCTVGPQRVHKKVSMGVILEYFTLEHFVYRFGAMCQFGGPFHPQSHSGSKKTKWGAKWNPKWNQFCHSGRPLKIVAFQTYSPGSTNFKSCSIMLQKTWKWREKQACWISFSLRKIKNVKPDENIHIYYVFSTSDHQISVRYNIHAEAY